MVTMATQDASDRMMLQYVVQITVALLKGSDSHEKGHSKPAAGWQAMLCCWLLSADSAGRMGWALCAEL
jgi:hypothetical protein